MKEVKVYSSLLFVLLIASYYSYTREEPKPGTTDKVTILDTPKEALKSLALYTKTQTVSVSLKNDQEGKEYVWFVVQQDKKTRSFVGGDKIDKLLEGFAPFRGIRSLGKLTGAELEETKLVKPERKLVIGLKSGDKTFDLGGRTSGARDHYVRGAGAQEVFLVGSSVLGDLEFPEGRFMQRKLRDKELKDIEKVMINANGKVKTAVHKNRLSPGDAFWASEDKQEEKSETLGNYVDKLDKLTVAEYPNEGDKFPENGTPILTATWYGDDVTKPLAVTEIYRVGQDKAAEYYARSSSTRMLVKLSKFSAEQVDRDLSTALAD